MFSYPSTCSHRDLCLWVLHWQVWFSGFSCCLLKFGRHDLFCDLTSLIDLRGVVDFSICSAFYLLGRIGLLPSSLYIKIETRCLIDFFLHLFQYWIVSIEDFLFCSFNSCNNHGNKTVFKSKEYRNYLNIKAIKINQKKNEMLIKQYVPSMQSHVCVPGMFMWKNGRKESFICIKHIFWKILNSFTMLERMNYGWNSFVKLRLKY